MDKEEFFNDMVKVFIKSMYRKLSFDKTINKPLDVVEITFDEELNDYDKLGWRMYVQVGEKQYGNSIDVKRIKLPITKYEAQTMALNANYLVRGFFLHNDCQYLVSDEEYQRIQDKWMDL